MRGHSSLRGNPYSRHNGGFTLVELVISILLVGMLAAVGSSMIVDSFSTTRMVNADTASAAQARYALERLAREIREVKYCTGSSCPGAVSGYCLDTWTASQLIFKTRTAIANTGSTNRTSCTTEVSTVTITYSSPNLTLGGANLATQVDTTAATPFRFDYYQIDGTTTATTTDNIKFVRITLTVKDSTSGQSIVQRTSVALRNE
jgi:prepilin-type N-terminal cleavage/methylation domain-containing protein